MTKKQEETESIVMGGIAIIFLLGLFGLMCWLTSRPTPPPETMTACGGDKDKGQDVWACREYRQINYKLDIK